MPRPNRARTIDGEANLARRIRMEREERGWSYETLAQCMTDAGCPIQGSAIFKVEKGEPRRRVTVDELLALAKVFGLTVENLLTPVDLLRDERGRQIVADIEAAMESLVDAADALRAAYLAYHQHLPRDPELEEYVNNHVHEERDVTRRIDARFPSEDVIEPFVNLWLALANDAEDAIRGPRKMRQVGEVVMTLPVIRDETEA